MQYRADISGLRALAVLPVVLYHVDARFMPGGFVGVDVFFVISGYLITSILAKEMGQGRFSFLTFYDRRIRRIVPAYALVMLVTTLAAVATLPPLMLELFGRSLQYASIFLANQHFLATAGYFNPGAEEHLLLHTWSLAVEEQFYLFWPVVLLALFHPRLARWRGLIVWGLLLASLALASQNAIQRPHSAFYSFTARGWELLMGAVLALGLLPRLSGRLLPELAGAAGLAMIVAAVALFDARTVFPGYSALLPTGGALLLLWAGEGGRRTLAGRLLSLWPLTAIGLVSYSLYLWHWPVLGLFKFHMGRHPGMGEGLALVGLAIGLSVLTYRYVETPFRRHGAVVKREEWRSVLVGLMVLGALALCGLLLTKTKGLPQRASAEYAAAEAGLRDIWEGTPKCLLGPGAAPRPAACRFGAAGDDRPLIALWGDSYADHHGPALDFIAREAGYGLVQDTKGGCAAQAPGTPDLTGLGTETDACEAFRANRLAQLVADPQVRVVVIGGRWPGGERQAGAMARLEEAVRALRQAGKGVVLVGTPPYFSDGGGARCILRRRFLGLSEDVCSISAARAASQAQAQEEALAQVARDVPGVELVLPRGAFCDGATCRPTLPDGRLGFIDAGHMNRAGSLHATPLLKVALDRALAQWSGATTPTKP
ncbi:acyltransferase family protein [Xanthobacteraceae bacterium A53D]